MPSTNSPKVELLKNKLALIMGCLSPIYGEVRAAHPDALNEAWSSRMDGERIYAILNNETFAISEVDDPNLASLIARGVDPIDAGENIELYLNDVHTRSMYHEHGTSAHQATLLSPESPNYWLLSNCVTYMRKLSNNRGMRTSDDEELRADILAGYIERTLREAHVLGYGEEEDDERKRREYVGFFGGSGVNGVDGFREGDPGEDIVSAYVRRCARAKGVVTMGNREKEVKSKLKKGKSDVKAGDEGGPNGEGVRGAASQV